MLGHLWIVTLEVQPVLPLLQLGDGPSQRTFLANPS